MMQLGQAQRAWAVEGSFTLPISITAFTLSPA
jgi:hypothetical protein